MKFYGKIGGLDISGYDVTLVGKPWFIRHLDIETIYKDYTLFDSDTDTLLDVGLTTLLDMKTLPPKGSNVYIAPNCPLAMDDIRNNYTIKKKPDTGDYNVFSSINTRRTWEINTAIIVQKLHSVIFLTQRNVTSNVDAVTIAKATLAETVSEEDVHLINSISSLYFGKGCDAYTQLLEKKYKKTCVYYKNLDINSAVELTLDSLMLVYNTGKVQSRSKDAVDNFVLQLNALNQYNWREYPGTIRALLTEILPNECGVRNYVSNTISKFPKQVKGLIQNHFNLEFHSKKDFDMCKEMIETILGSKDIRFCTYADLKDHLDEKHISTNLYNTFFNMVVKITEKEYEEGRVN